MTDRDLRSKFWITKVLCDPVLCDPVLCDPVWGDPVWGDPLWIICCGPHEVRDELHRQVTGNSRPNRQIGIVIGFGFGWLTLNRIEFATKDTRRLLPGRIFGLPLDRESPTSQRTSPLDCLARRKVNFHPPINCDRTQ